MDFLGISEIYVRHTGGNIKDLVMEIFGSYGTKMKQILSVTTDNAEAI